MKITVHKHEYRSPTQQQKYHETQINSNKKSHFIESKYRNCKLNHEYSRESNPEMQDEANPVTEQRKARGKPISKQRQGKPLSNKKNKEELTVSVGARRQRLTQFG